MAMACLRLFTRPPFPPLPDLSVPLFLRRIALATVFPAAFPYLREDFFRGMPTSLCLEEKQWQEVFRSSCSHELDTGLTSLTYRTCRLRDLGAKFILDGEKNPHHGVHGEARRMLWTASTGGAHRAIAVRACEGVISTFLPASRATTVSSFSIDEKRWNTS